MGNIDQKAPSKGQDEVVFKSEDIATRTKAGQKKKYFVKFKEKPLKVRLSEWFAKYKKKILIIMCVTVAALVLIATIITIITALTRPKSVPEKNWSQEISTAQDEVEKYVNESSAPNPFADMNDHYRTAYESETDQDKKFITLIAWARYLTENQQYKDALDALFSAQFDHLSDAQLFQLYASIQTVYIKLGDEVNANLWGDLIEGLDIVMGGEDE